MAWRCSRNGPRGDVECSGSSASLFDLPRAGRRARCLALRVAVGWITQRSMTMSEAVVTPHAPPSDPLADSIAKELRFLRQERDALAPQIARLDARERALVAALEGRGALAERGAKRDQRRVHALIGHSPDSKAGRLKAIVNGLEAPAKAAKIRDLAVAAGYVEFGPNDVHSSLYTMARGGAIRHVAKGLYGPLT